MGRGIQITNTVLLGLIAVLLTLFNITIIVTSLSTGAGIFQGLLTLSGIIYLLIWITSVFYFILLILSFKKCNIENKSFKWAFYLNVTWIALAFLLYIGMIIFITAQKPTTIAGSIDVIDKANSFSGIAQIFIGIIYAISFIVFVIGYFKNKQMSISNT